MELVKAGNSLENYQIYDSFSNPADSYDIKGMPKVDWGRPYNIKSNVRTFNLKETYKTTDEIKNARFYEPGNLGHEKQTKEWLQKLREQ